MVKHRPSKRQAGKQQYWWLGVVAVGLVGVALSVQPRWQFERQTDRPLSPPPGQTTPASETPADRVYRQVNPAVVTIYSGDAIGSGSIVRADGLVLTNRHVVENGLEAKVKTASGETFNGRVIAIDLRYDLALVKLKTQTPSANTPSANTPFPTVPMPDSIAPINASPGQVVYAIGSPGGKAGTLTRGTLTRITEHGSLQTSPGLLQPGNSGGPLLNANGDLIGINKGTVEDNSGLATSITIAQKFLERHQPRTGSDGTTN